MDKNRNNFCSFFFFNSSDANHRACFDITIKTYKGGINRMSDSYLFTEKIQEDILALLIRDKNTYEVYKECVKPKYFEKEIHNDIYRITLDYYNKYNKPLDMNILINEVNVLINGSKIKEKLTDDYITAISHIFKYDMNSAGYIRDKIAEFGRKQALSEAILESADILQKGGDYGKIEKIIKNALLVGQVNDMGVNYWEGMPERINKYSESSDVIERITTGQPTLDGIFNGGLGRSEMGIIIAPPGRGKAVSPETLVLTPKGYILIKNLSVGDKVISVDGTSCNVTNIFDHEKKHMYKITFSDGAEVVCCDEHLWSVQTRDDRKNHKGIYRTLELKEIMKNFRVERGKRCNYSIPTLQGPVEFENSEKLLIDPWVMGAFIGDGCSSNNLFFTNAEPDLIKKFNKKLPLETSLKKLSKSEIDYNIVSTIKLGKYEKSYFRKALERYNLYGKKSYDKFIPKEYLMASIEDRLELLRGLLDTDACVKDPSSMSYSTSSKQLRDDIIFLAQSLGCSTSCCEKMGKYSKELNGEKIIKTTRMNYIVTIHSYNGLCIVSSEKHLKKYRVCSEKRVRYISNIEYLYDGPARCITVDHPSELFVIKDTIVTHNTTMLQNLGAAAVEAGYNVVHIFFENNEAQITRNYDLRFVKKTFNYLKENVSKVISALLNRKKYSKGKLFIKKYPVKGATVNTIKAYINQLQNIEGITPDVVIVDYGSLLKSTVGYKDKRDEYEAIYIELRSIADEFNCALWTGAQTNRTSLSKKVVTMADLAECFAIANAADVLVALCQSVKEQKLQIMRYFIGKCRDQKDHMTLQGKDYRDSKVMTVDKVVTDEDENNGDDDDDIVSDTGTGNL